MSSVFQNDRRGVRRVSSFFERMAVPFVIGVTAVCVAFPLMQKTYYPVTHVRLPVELDPRDCNIELSSANLARLRHASRLRTEAPLDIEVLTLNQDRHHACLERPGALQSMFNELRFSMADLPQFTYKASFVFGDKTVHEDRVRTAGK